MGRQIQKARCGVSECNGDFSPTTQQNSDL